MSARWCALRGTRSISLAGLPVLKRAEARHGSLRDALRERVVFTGHISGQAGRSVRSHLLVDSSSERPAHVASVCRPTSPSASDSLIRLRLVVRRSQMGTHMPDVTNESTTWTAWLTRARGPSSTTEGPSRDSISAPLARSAATAARSAPHLLLSLLTFIRYRPRVSPASIHPTRLTTSCHQLVPPLQ